MEPNRSNDLRECDDLHDWEIVATLSEPRERRLTLHLEWPYSSLNFAKRADLVFEGVLGHFLSGERDDIANYINEIRASSVASTLERYAFLFSWHGWDWPVSSPTHDCQGLIAELERRGVCVFEIHPVAGLTGFVLATSAYVRTAADPH